MSRAEEYLLSFGFPKAFGIVSQFRFDGDIYAKRGIAKAFETPMIPINTGSNLWLNTAPATMLFGNPMQFGYCFAGLVPKKPFKKEMWIPLFG